jgi:hypothetical protein
MFKNSVDSVKGLIKAVQRIDPGMKPRKKASRAKKR